MALRIMKYAESVGHTLDDAASAGIGMFAACAVFVLDPDDPGTAPGKQAWEGIGLPRAMAADPSLKNARIAAYNKYMGEHVFRVRKE